MALCLVIPRNELEVTFLSAALKATQTHIHTHTRIFRQARSEVLILCVSVILLYCNGNLE